MKKAIKLFILTSIFICNSINAQMPPCQWGHSADASGTYLGTSIATDASGNVFLGGSFISPTIAFGTTTLSNFSGTSDLFIVKYSPSGSVLWANSAGGQFEDEVLGVCTDAGGNLFVTGHFSSPILVFGTTTLTNAYGSEDIFVVKYSPSGTVLWANSIGGSGINNDEGYGVSTDASGNVFVTGGFASPTIAFGTTTLTNAGGGGGYTDVFVAKFSPLGAVLWATSAGGTDIDLGNSVSTDASGNAYVTGTYRSATVMFGTTTLTNAGTGNKDLFIAKYSPSGTVLWTRSAGGLYNDNGNGVSTDASGNAFITGSFNSPNLTFGTNTLTIVPGVAGTTDIFIAKYSPSGTVLWASSVGGSNYDDGNGVTIDANGNAFITGSFSSSNLVFGTSTITNTAGGLNYTDIFVAKYSPSGNTIWAGSAGGTIYDIGYGVSTDASGNLFITGSFSSSGITFGSTTLTNVLEGDYDIFVAKLGSAITDIGENETFKSGISIYPNPFSSQTTITFSEAQSNTTVKILDVLGNEVMVIPNVMGKELIIEMGKMQSGIYFVQIMDDRHIFPSKKIILQ